MSDGDIIQIPDRTVYTDNNGQAILDSIQWFEDYVAAQQALLDSYLEDLAEAVGNYDPQITPVDVEVPTIDGPSFPESPNWPPLDLNFDWPDMATTPIFMPYPDLEFEYTAPILPDPIDGNFDWTLEVYTSEMWTALFDKVHGDILNGGTGLTDEVHSAIVEREQETRRLNQDREYQQGLDAVGATGFNLPSGHVASFQRSFQSEMLLRDQDALNNLTIKDFDLATENTRFAVTTGVELEKLLRATWEAAQRMGLEAATAAYNYVVAVYEANIKAYLAQWEGVRIELEALKIQVDAIASANESMVKVWLGQADVYKTEIEAIVSQNEGLVDIRQSEVEVYKTETQAIAVQYEALVAEVEAQIKATALEVEQAIENSKIDLEAYNAQTGFAVEVSKAVAQIGAQVTASALQGINTQLTHSFGSSQRISEGWTHGESLQEGHSFNEV